MAVKNRKISDFPRRSDRQRLAELYTYIDLCMSEIYDQVESKGLPNTWSMFAAIIGCCGTTARKLWYHDTQYPRYETIQKLADAAGFAIEFKRIAMPGRTKQAA